MNKKTCCVCRESKSLDCFSKNVKTKDQLRYACKSCSNKKQKEYRQNNADKLKKAQKIYYINNKEKLQTSKQNYYEQNKDKAISNNRKWRNQNPEKVTNANHLRRSRKLNNGHFVVTVDEINKLYGSNCFYCGSSDSIQIDHVIPLSRGGTHSIGNLVAACAKCNLRKGNKYLSEWLLQVKI